MIKLVFDLLVFSEAEKCRVEQFWIGVYCNEAML
jgi:hypothetical protein